MNARTTLVAATALTATALSAQTNIPVMANTDITVSGLLAVGLKNAEVTNTTRTGLGNETFLGDNTSRLIIGSTSKIMDGWMVIFRVESRFQATYGPGTALVSSIPSLGTNGATYGGWAEGDTWGGISSPYGAITFGKSTLYYTDTIDMSYLGLAGGGEAYRIWDANGLATFNLLDSVNQFKGGACLPGSSVFTLGNTRSQDVVKYSSPKFSGFDVQLAWSKNPYGSTLNGLVAPPNTPVNYENGGTVYGKLSYVNGPFNASFSALKVRTQGGGNGAADGSLTGFAPSVEAYRIGTAYKWASGFRLGLVFDHTANRDAADGVNTAARDAYEVPVSYTLGDHAFYVTWTSAGNTNNYTNSGATQWNLGYDYALTKRAFIGIAWWNIKNQSNANYTPFLAGTNLGPTLNLMPGENIHQIGINLNYWF
jgi:outer membrane protein W